MPRGGPVDQVPDRNGTEGPLRHDSDRDPTRALTELASLAPDAVVRCMHAMGNPTTLPPALVGLLAEDVALLPLDALTHMVIDPSGNAALHQAWLDATVRPDRTGTAHVKSAGPMQTIDGRVVDAQFLMVHMYDLVGVPSFEVMVATLEPTPLPPTDHRTSMVAFRLHLDRFGAIIDCAGDVAGALGRHGDDLIGTLATDLIHPADVDGCLADWVAVLSTPELPHPGRVRLCQDDGSWRWFEFVNWNALADPGIRAVVTELLDIDAQVKVEQLGVASSRAHERLVRVLDDVDDMVLIGHPDAGLVYWNHAAEARLTDLRTGVPIGDLMAPTVAHLVDSTIRPLFDRMERWSGDLDLEFRDGQVHTLAATVTPVLDGAEARYFGVILRDVTTERRHARQLDELAHVDPLTSLPNRLSLNEMLSAISANDVALCFIDLDHLKVVNDGLGHGAGDKLLVAVADALVEIAGSGTVTRFGGDEFVVVHSDVGSIDQATDLATKLLHAIEDVRVPDVPTRLSASVGVAWTPIDDLDPEELIKNADTAMYAAKRRGRGRIARFDHDQREAVTRRFVLETALQQAITNDEIQAYFQPVVSIEDGHIGGFEALARWDLVSPAEFVPTAEESGLIIPLGSRILHRSLDNLVRIDDHWRTNLPAGSEPTAPATVVSVNVSGRELLEPSFAQRTLQALADRHLSADRLVLELTESVLIDTLDEVDQTLRTLRDAGVSLVLDDFGTGYSSIAYLRRYPIDGLKLDISYTRALMTNTDTRVIAEIIIELGRRLGLSIVAEGVEEQAQVDVLRELGVPWVQGYLMAHPMAVDDLLAGPLADPLSRLRHSEG